MRLRKQAMTLAEFIAHEGDAFPMPRLERKVLVQAHCHHKAILNFGDEEQVLRKMGMEIDAPDSGCCGMAGAFGFEKEHYDVSMRVGERVLLPAVREAAADTLILADGFSCREQIAQTTNRRAVHIADVIKLALDNRSAVS
jgi:Fe-S oxidoreductase